MPNHLQSLRGLGRLAYRNGQFPHHACKVARDLLGRDLTTEDRQAIATGWCSERSETTR